MVIYNNMTPEEENVVTESNKDPFDLVMESISDESTIDDMMDKLDIQYEKGLVDDITYQEQKEALNARRLNVDNNKNYKESAEEPDEDPNMEVGASTDLFEVEESSKDLTKASKKCTKCGSANIGLFIHGKPVYKCKDCGEYLGTKVFSTKESVNDPKDSIRKAYSKIKSIISEKTIEELTNLPESLSHYAESSKNGSELMTGIEVD